MPVGREPLRHCRGLDRVLTANDGHGDDLALGPAGGVRGLTGLARDPANERCESLGWCEVPSKSLRQRSHSQPEHVEVALVPGQQSGTGEGVDQMVRSLTVDRDPLTDLPRREAGLALSDGDQNRRCPCDGLDAGLCPSLRADGVALHPMVPASRRHPPGAPGRSEPPHGASEQRLARGHYLHSLSIYDQRGIAGSDWTAIAGPDIDWPSGWQLFG